MSSASEARQPGNAALHGRHSGRVGCVWPVAVNWARSEAACSRQVSDLFQRFCCGMVGPMQAKVSARATPPRPAHHPAATRGAAPCPPTLMPPTATRWAMRLGRWWQRAKPASWPPCPVSAGKQDGVWLAGERRLPVLGGAGCCSRLGNSASVHDATPSLPNALHVSACTPACCPRPFPADLQQPAIQWTVGGTPLLAMMHLERRSGR